METGQGNTNHSPAGQNVLSGLTVSNFTEAFRQIFSDRIIGGIVSALQ